MDGARAARNMVSDGMPGGFFRFVFYLAMVCGCFQGVGGNNERRCRAEQECHFGATANLVLNLTEPVSPSNPLALALARFTVVPKGCAAYFQKFVDARNKLPPEMLKAAGNSESLCDSKRVFDSPDLVVATFVAIVNAVTVVVMGCAIDKRLHPFET